MLSAVIDSGVCTAAFRGISYVFCRAFNQPSAFEKAVLVTILVGLGILAGKAIKSEYPANTHFRDSWCSSRLAVIPCTLYIGDKLI